MRTDHDPVIACGISLAAPLRTDALVERYGGALDDAARGRTLTRILPSYARPDAAAITPLLRASSLARVTSGWGLLLVSESLATQVHVEARWVHPQASWVLASLLADDAAEPPAGDERHLALIEPGADIAKSARIGAFAVVRSKAVIGEDCVIEPHAVVYGGVVLGRRVHVGAGAVIGRPGFGWAVGPEAQVVRVPQRGGVVIEDDVEIGPLVTIDAGTLAPTHLGRGAKLDAHVHVAHNVAIGAGAFIAAQSGFAGSSTLGTGVHVGGQVGVADHVRVGDRARLAAKAGVIGDVPEGATYAGYPAMPRLRWLRAIAAAVALGRRGARDLLGLQA